MGRLIDADKLIEYLLTPPWNVGWDDEIEIINNQPTVEAIPKDNIYKAIQEMMKYEHEGFINISLARLDEILKQRMMDWRYCQRDVTGVIAYFG